MFPAGAGMNRPLVHLRARRTGKGRQFVGRVDEIIIALQQLRERLRRMAQQDGPPHKPRKTRS